MSAHAAGARDGRVLAGQQQQRARSGAQRAGAGTHHPVQRALTHALASLSCAVMSLSMACRLASSLVLSSFLKAASRPLKMVSSFSSCSVRDMTKIYGRIASTSRPDGNQGLHQAAGCCSAPLLAPHGRELRQVFVTRFEQDIKVASGCFLSSTAPHNAGDRIDCSGTAGSEVCWVKRQTDCHQATLYGPSGKAQGVQSKLAQRHPLAECMTTAAPAKCSSTLFLGRPAAQAAG